MNFWREKKNRFYFCSIVIIAILIGQYFLFKYGIVSPLVKGVELRITKGEYIQNIDEYVIKLGDSIKVNSGEYIVIPPYASKPNIGYKASDSDVLSIKGDTITGIKEGYSAIMIMKDSRAIRKATIRVVNPKVENLDVSINQLKYVGDTSPIDVNVDVDFKFNDKEQYTYEISDKKVLKIENNKVKAIGVGSSTLKIKAGDKTKEYKFNIQAKVSNLYSNNNINVHINEEKSLGVKVETHPKNLEHPKVNYEIVGFKFPIATAIEVSSDGIVTGIREGSEKVKVTCGGKSKIITVNVLKENTESKKIKNLEASSIINGDNLEINLSWDYLDDVPEYEIYLKNNSKGEKDFSLIKSIKVEKGELDKNKKVKASISIDLKGIEKPDIDLYVVGKSDGVYTQRSDTINIKKEHPSAENIQDYKVENLEGTISDDGNINLSWDKLENFDCTYSIYVRNNITSPNGGFELYQHGVSENNITIPVNLLEDINMDVYVVANSSQGSSKSSDVLNLEKKKTEIEVEKPILQIKNPESTF
ncbi:hypothetical protein [Paraclostridium bifermentans]|uniref:hypothetical protein n=1 Tax=Paraclostridium bifermentans TaxID=1490 RepID=UPI001C81F633|nr:hypothetical protein [Paraclostridium bifermentans]GIM33821.1 hypothetical protein PAGU1678_30900 [Paraclostridium bifermentans subsp. muricolitidis]